jgi:hypothetical protein
MSSESFINNLLSLCSKKEITPVLNLLKSSDQSLFLEKVEDKDALDHFTDYSLHSLPILFYL